ncbi:hypothetical protein, partial [Stutzerimonas nitrititolerans]|uniref:hypothetical protein n=1 Tax=Stutzerimonas nitrititolerans TaxID=2482751 RepID=UPI002897B1D4
RINGHTPELRKVSSADAYGVPPFEIVTGERAAKSFYQNDWALVFNAGSGLNWDALVYLPKKNYQDISSKTLLGDWIYLHE